MIIIQTPYKYMQGPGLIKELGKHVKSSGKKFLILSSKTPLSLYKDVITKSFEAEEGVSCEFTKFCGEVTRAERDRVADMAKGYDAIIAIGGGKTIDTGKSSANKAGVKFISMPTTASSDAPCSACAVIYNEEGVVIDFEFYATNPSLVIMDSEVIANSPVHTLVAGMGDALATYIESRVCVDHGFTNCFLSHISLSAAALAKLCYDTLLSDGLLAKQSAEKHIVTQQLENIIEANTYLSGIGFESGGLACAHSIQDALTAVPECHKFMHGDRVAFGALCQLVLENRKEEIEEVLEFCTSVGLPVTLRQLGLTEGVEEKVKGVMHIAYAELSAYHMPPKTTSDNLYAAILLANQIGEDYLAAVKECC
jgi:glycerol dehydrogenase